MNNTVSNIAQALKSCTELLISVHKDPDGDALGSQIALMLALEKLGKRVRAHNIDPVPDIYRFLPDVERITHGAKINGAFDALVVLDAEPARTHLFSGAYPAPLLINIDHHVTNPQEWPLTWLDTGAAATGEMIYLLIHEMGVLIDSDMALCLYTAIFTDTGSFRYSNTTSKSMKIAASLLEEGADPWLVTEHVYESLSYDRLKLLGHVLAGMERSSDGRTAWVVITEELYRRTGTTADDTENFVNFVRSVKGVEVAVLFRQTGRLQYKVSLRSKGRIDLSIVAQSLGGGGHKNASGCVLDGEFEEVRFLVLSAVESAIQQQMGSTAR